MSVISRILFYCTILCVGGMRAEEGSIKLTIGMPFKDASDALEKAKFEHKGVMLAAIASKDLSARNVRIEPGVILRIYYRKSDGLIEWLQIWFFPAHP